MYVRLGRSVVGDVMRCESCVTRLGNEAPRMVRGEPRWLVGWSAGRSYDRRGWYHGLRITKSCQWTSPLHLQLYCSASFPSLVPVWTGIWSLLLLVLFPIILLFLLLLFLFPLLFVLLLLQFLLLCIYLVVFCLMFSLLLLSRSTHPPLSPPPPSPYSLKFDHHLHLSSVTSSFALLIFKLIMDVMSNNQWISQESWLGWERFWVGLLTAL